MDALFSDPGDEVVPILSCLFRSYASHGSPGAKRCYLYGCWQRVAWTRGGSISFLLTKSCLFPPFECVRTEFSCMCLHWGSALHWPNLVQVDWSKSSPYLNDLMICGLQESLTCRLSFCCWAVNVVRPHGTWWTELDCTGHCTEDPRVLWWIQLLGIMFM